MNINVQKEEKMKKLLVPTMMGVLFLLAPFYAIAADVTGSIQGYNSVTQASPAGNHAHISAHTAATETAFVVLDDAAKGKHYLIQDVDKAVLARLVNQQVKIDGDLDKGTESIKAKNIYVVATDKSWKKIWAKDVTDNIYRNAEGSHPLLSGS
jgi:hypothetical protein